MFVFFLLFIFVYVVVIVILLLHFNLGSSVSVMFNLAAVFEIFELKKSEASKNNLSGKRKKAGKTLIIDVKNKQARYIKED